MKLSDLFYKKKQARKKKNFIVYKILSEQNKALPFVFKNAKLHTSKHALFSHLKFQKKNVN